MIRIGKDDVLLPALWVIGHECRAELDASHDRSRQLQLGVDVVEAPPLRGRVGEAGERSGDDDEMVSTLVTRPVFASVAPNFLQSLRRKERGGIMIMLLIYECC